MKPEEVYGRRERAYGRRHARLQVAANRLSNWRLYTCVAGLAAAAFLYRAASPLIGTGAGLLTLVLFGYLAYRHERVRRQLRYAEALHSLNQKGLDRAAGRWGAFPDTGADFGNDDHPYASDLDLFGRASLFQWITSATTPLGRETLARALQGPTGDRLEIIARQEAVTELAGKLAWRQRFEAEGFLAGDRLEPLDPLLQWAAESHQAYLHPLVKLGIRVLPVITISLAALYAFQGAVPWQAPAVLVAAQALLLLAKGKERSRSLSIVYHQEARLRTYARMLELFEQQRCQAQWLKTRQGRLRDKAGRSAYQQVYKLSTIAERIANRANAIFMIVNILTLWDYQCMIWLGEWKEESGRKLKTWLQVLADIEAHSSLANIRFEHPDWATPTVVEDLGGFSARNLGHPLIVQNRVSNDFELKAPAGIAVLTGSNMSGKSTFLRTVGINLVLAYVGAPVCAERFQCSLMSLWTSMRTADNLEQKVSSFYAELLRISRIVDAARTQKHVCFLLDEVFKGTNSHDRHVGAKALITQLQRDGAIGLISTHDLELGSLEQESNGHIKNYHFREYYQDQKIHFDYRLRQGVSTTRNALHLIKLMGIEVQA